MAPSVSTDIRKAATLAFYYRPGLTAQGLIDETAKTPEKPWSFAAYSDTEREKAATQIVDRIRLIRRIKSSAQIAASAIHAKALIQLAQLLAEWESGSRTLASMEHHIKSATVNGIEVPSKNGEDVVLEKMVEDRKSHAGRATRGAAEDIEAWPLPTPANQHPQPSIVQLHRHWREQHA